MLFSQNIVLVFQNLLKLEASMIGVYKVSIDVCGTDLFEYNVPNSHKKYIFQEKYLFFPFRRNIVHQNVLYDEGLLLTHT
jgi:hypothetical protein